MSQKFSPVCRAICMGNWTHIRTCKVIVDTGCTAPPLCVSSTPCDKLVRDMCELCPVLQFPLQECDYLRLCVCLIGSICLGSMRDTLPPQEREYGNWRGIVSGSQSRCRSTAFQMHHGQASFSSGQQIFSSYSTFSMLMLHGQPILNTHLANTTTITDFIKNYSKVSCTFTLVLK